MPTTTFKPTRPSLSPWGKGAAALGIGALALIAVGLLFPAGAAFFPLVSLWCSCVLFYGALWVLRVSGVELDFFHRAVLIGGWAAAVLYFYWALGRRDFVYAWDYANYLVKQYSAEAAFALGPAEGFRYIFGSFAEDYTNFIPLFTEFPFCLTARTGDSYAFSQVFSVLPTLMVLLAGVVLKVGQMLHVKHRFYYFLIGFSWLLTFPFLRMSAMLSQPDWFGLIFAFAILVLTLDYRFEKLEPGRFALIFLATAAVILTRRWYLYFVVGYYFSYVLLVLCSSVRAAKQGEKALALRRVRNLVVFGLCSLAAMVALLWPMVSKILAYDYSDRYSYYNVGGMSTELYYHALRIGLLNFILIVLGLVYAVRRKAWALPALGACELVVSLVLFTRVQNSGSHQMLLFVPAYFLLFLVGAAALAEGIERHKIVKLGYWAFTLVFAVSVRCSPLTVVALPDFIIDNFPLKSTEEFVRLDGLTYDRKDLAQIQSVTEWLAAHLGDGETAYMIPDDMLYNPGHLRNCLLPEQPLDGKLPDSFSVPGTHNFPMSFFEAKYVITIEPYPLSYASETELGHKLNAKFTELRDDTHTLAAEFDMDNGYIFTIWERVEAPTREEVETYLHVFDAENAQYPEMFSQVAEGWLTAHGL